MFSQLFKSTILRSNVSQPSLNKSMMKMMLMSQQPRRFYMPNGSQLMEREEGDYYSDPVNVAERVVRLIALHDNVRDPAAVKLNASFESLGLNELDMVEILLQAEREFDVEISEDDCESFHSVNDIVEHLAKQFHTK